MNIDDIVKEAGYWHEPITQAISFIETHPEREGIAYQLQRLRVENILTQFYVFKPRPVYEYYKTMYENAIKNNQPTTN